MIFRESLGPEVDLNVTDGQSGGEAAEEPLSISPKAVDEEVGIKGKDVVDP